MAWIIKDNRVKHEIKCNSCDSIIGFTKGDIKEDILEVFGEYIFYARVKCPACGNYIVVEAKY